MLTIVKVPERTAEEVLRDTDGRRSSVRGSKEHGIPLPHSVLTFLGSMKKSKREERALYLDEKWPGEGRRRICDERNFRDERRYLSGDEDQMKRI